MSEEKNSINLLPISNVIRIGKYNIDLGVTCARRTLETVSLYNKAISKNDGDLKNTIRIVESLLNVIRVDFKITNFFEWLKRKCITTRYILNNLDVKEVSNFVESALSSINGSKKKAVMERAQEQNRLHKIGMKVIENASPEVLKKILSKSV